MDPERETINPPPPAPTTPSATPAPPPAAVAPEDRTAPRATVKLPRQTLAHALDHGLRLRVGCSEACRVDAQLTLGGRIAKALGLAKTEARRRRRPAAARAGGAVVLRFTAKARRRLAHTRRVTSR